MDSKNVLEMMSSAFPRYQNFENRFSRNIFRLDQKSIKNIFWDTKIKNFAKISNGNPIFPIFRFSEKFSNFRFFENFQWKFWFSKFHFFDLKNIFDWFLIKSKNISTESIFKISVSGKSWDHPLWNVFRVHLTNI